MNNDLTPPHHILIVDDNPAIRDFINGELQVNAAYRITTAQNGLEALQTAKLDPPDLILLDYKLPRMSAVDLLRKFGEQDALPPVILLTSDTSEAVVAEVLRYGVVDYLSKPFQVVDLVASVRSALISAHLQEERDTLFGQLRDTNDALKQRIQELDTLYRVSKAVTTLEDRDSLLERIVDAALRLTLAMEGQLVLFDETGIPKTTIRRKQVGVSSPVYNPVKEQNFYTMTEGLMAMTVLKVGERTLGSLMISNKSNREPIDKHDNVLLRMLGDYAAIAIRNLEMFSEVEAKRERETRQLRSLFEHYVAPSVVKRILTNPELVSPGGQRQNIAVLFADLRGFTQYSTKIEPENLVKVINHYLTIAAEAILAEEGTLDKFMGDEAMAFFNAPLRQADYAKRAVRAAWRIMHETYEFHKRIKKSNQLHFGVGISTGEAIVGNLGTAHVVNYTVLGSTVNIGHALQEMTPAGHIYICQNTYMLIQDIVRIKRMPKVKLKGQVSPAHIYDVLDVKV